MKRNLPARDILEKEAHLRAQLTTYRQLSISTGYSEQYIANFVGRLIRKFRRCEQSCKPRRDTSTLGGS